MRPRERRETGEQDLFRSRLDRIIDLTHGLVKLSRAIDWRFLEAQFGSVYSDGPGCPPLPTRLMAGLARLLVDAGYRGHNAPTDYKFRVYTSGQKRRLTPQIKRELRRRAAIEPVIGHLKAEHRMGRNYLANHA